MYKRRRLLLGAAAAVLVLLVFVMRAVGGRGGAGQAGGGPAGATGAAAETQRPTASVRIAPVTRGDIILTRSVNGSITALKEVTLSSKLLAPVRSVAVREGDPVRRGQVVIQLDPTDFQSQVRQQEAALRAAEARLTQARANLALAEDQLRNGIRVAEQALVSAKARLAITQKGARRQERSVAQNAVETARSAVESARAGVGRANADRDLAATNLRRVRNLFRQGAIAQAQVDTAEQQMKVADAALEVAQAQLRAAQQQVSSAEQQLSLIEEGARTEEIETAEAQVRTAEENLRLARDNRQNVEAKRQDVRSAQAAVAQSRAALDYAREQLANTAIVSPIEGVVSSRNVEPGQTAGVGVPLMTLVDLDTVYFGADVSETDLPALEVGKPVSVTVDAFAGRRFRGSVQRIFPSGDRQSRTFTVRVSVPNPRRELKPGMFARGTVEASRLTDVVLVPKDALAVAGSPVPVSGASVAEAPGKVFVYDDGSVALRTVTLGASGPNAVEVRRGLQPGESVVISGTGLQEGDKVRVAD